MKKIVFTAMAMVLILAAIFAVSTVNAKPYKPFTFSGTAEIPDDAVLPNYLGRLEMARTIYDGAPDGSTLMITFFKDPYFQYFDEDGNEFAPYVEILKIEIKDGKGRVNLVSFVFINTENKMETYVDEKALWEPATGKLTKVESYYKKPFVKVKTPREKTE